MKGPARIAILASIPLLLLCLAWQAGRYDKLSSEARRLESSQEQWLQENRKLEAGIRILSSRERAASLAEGLGLEKATPEQRLRVVLPERGGEGGHG